MLKIGIIGTGYFGEIHIKVLLKLKNIFKIIGFFDINKKKCKEISEKYGIPLLKLDQLIQSSQHLGHIAAPMLLFLVVQPCVLEFAEQLSRSSAAART